MDNSNTELVKYCEAQLGRGYWYGCYGQIASEKLYNEKKAQYPSQYTKWSKQSFTSQYGEKVHDCSGLFKGFLMTPRTDMYPNNEATYIAKYDMSADILIKKCTETGDISTIPNIPGLVVWRSGHVGCYLGNGYVIEAKGHSYGVVRTKLTDGTWKKWGKHPNIYYEEIKEEPSQSTGGANVELDVLKKGDKDANKGGDKGTQVKSLQALLNAKNNAGLDTDGSFGGKTDSAVRAYQQKMGLTNDGQVGSKTWSKLLKG